MDGQRRATEPGRWGGLASRRTRQVRNGGQVARAREIMRKRRCTVVLPKDTPGAGSYFGRCDLRRGHDGPHELERGFDTVRFDVFVIPYPGGGS